jgi:orotidine-5'-phosphate decarboxylase
MMEAAAEIFAKREESPLLIAVTVLTSMDQSDLIEIGLEVDPAQQVSRLATLAQSSGMDGVVCSPLEIELLRNELNRDFKLITPGIRPAGSATGDQKRVMTPADAVKMGSDWLVIGRPITQAPDPVAALHSINSSLKN